jgi:hypothetical protein
MASNTAPKPPRRCGGRSVAASYLFLGLVPDFPGSAKAEDTVPAAATPFCSADFLGFLISRFDRT